jgi:hypothetical protein
MYVTIPIDAYNDYEIRLNTDRVRRIQKIVTTDFVLIFHFHEHVFDFINYTLEEVDGFIKRDNFVEYYFADEFTLDAMLATIMANMNCIYIDDANNYEVNCVNLDLVNKIHRERADDFILRFHFGDNHYDTIRDNFNKDGYTREVNYIDYLFPDAISLNAVYDAIRDKIYKAYVLSTTATTATKIIDSRINGVVEIIFWNGGNAIEGWTQTGTEVEFTDGTTLIIGQTIKLIIR